MNESQNQQVGTSEEAEAAEFDIRELSLQEVLAVAGGPQVTNETP